MRRYLQRNRIAQNSSRKINLKLITQNPQKRRGFINGIGIVAKTFFGTMDADDEHLINEQLNLLENNQAIEQHEIKN